MSGCIGLNVRSINVTDQSLFPDVFVDLWYSENSASELSVAIKDTQWWRIKQSRLRCLLFFVSMFDGRACLSMYPDRVRFVDYTDKKKHPSDSSLTHSALRLLQQKDSIMNHCCSCNSHFCWKRMFFVQVCCVHLQLLGMRVLIINLTIIFLLFWHLLKWLALAHIFWFSVSGNPGFYQVNVIDALMSHKEKGVRATLIFPLYPELQGSERKQTAWKFNLGQKLQKFSSTDFLECLSREVDFPRMGDTRNELRWSCWLRGGYLWVEVGVMTDMGALASRRACASNPIHPPGTCYSCSCINSP